MNETAAIEDPVQNEPTLEFLPRDWARAHLGDLFEIQQGKALNAKKQSDGTPRPFLRTANVFWGHLDLAEVDQMTFSPEEERRLALKRGDLLTCEGGDVGRTSMWRGELERCYYQNHLHRLRSSRVDVDPEFYMRWMEAAILLLGLYGGTSNKTTIPNLSRNRLAAFAVPHPPVAEQRAVAAVLKAVNDANEACERVMTAARQLKASLLRHLFIYGPVSFEASDRVTLKETDIGAIPEHWQLGKIGEFATLVQYGLSLRGAERGSYPILRMNNLQNGRVLTIGVQGGVQYVELDSSTLEKFRLATGDILFNRTNSYELVGKTAVVEEDGDRVFASYLVRVRLDAGRLDPYFTNQYLNMATTQARLKSLASRAVSQSNINASKLKTFEIPIPPLDEQRQIAESLHGVDVKIRAEEGRHAALQALFASLLKSLMTGSLRLPEFADTP
jgi:type I restriction enzyme S subunit